MDSNTYFTRMKAALDLSVRDDLVNQPHKVQLGAFSEAFIYIKDHFGKCRCSTMHI
jgi:hypothetical protein